MELLQLVSSLKYNLQTWVWTWSTVPESDESGGNVGSCLHCLQIKSLDGSINPQTVRHIVEKSFLQDFSFSLAKEVFLENQVIRVLDFNCACSVHGGAFVNTATTPDLVPSLLAG